MSTRTVVVVHGAANADEVPGLVRAADVAEFRCANSGEDLKHALPGAQVMLGWDFRSGELEQAWPLARELRWIHWGGAGVDAMLFHGLIESDVVLTNMRGVFDQPMAEYTLGMILAAAKGFARTWRAQGERRWLYRPVDRIEHKSALVVGVGSIGRAVARMLTAAGMRVAGVGRRARDADPDFGAIHASRDLNRILGDFDYVVLIAPLTEQTRGMLGAQQLAAMKRGAWLVNIGRGALLDERALVDALREGRIAGAALDVFETEPLPEQSPLWEMENVFVSPHMSGDYVGYRGEMARLFVDNLRRYRAGEPLLNVVDKRLGFVTRD